MRAETTAACTCVSGSRISGPSFWVACQLPVSSKLDPRGPRRWQNGPPVVRRSCCSCLIPGDRNLESNRSWTSCKHAAHSLIKQGSPVLAARPLPRVMGLPLESAKSFDWSQFHGWPFGFNHGAHHCAADGAVFEARVLDDIEGGEEKVVRTTTMKCPCSPDRAGQSTSVSPELST